MSTPSLPVSTPGSTGSTNGIDRLDARFDTLQMTLLRVNGAIVAGLIGLIAAVLVRG